MRGGRWTCDADQSSQFSPPRSICFPRYQLVKLHTWELANRQRCRWNVLVIGRPNFPHPHRAWFAFEVVLPERVINSPVSNCLSGTYGPANLASHLISHFLFLYNWNTFQVPIVDSIVVSIFWLTLTNTESEMSRLVYPVAKMRTHCSKKSIHASDYCFWSSNIACLKRPWFW